VYQAAKKAAMSAAEKATAAAEQEANQGFKPAAIDQVRKIIFGDSVRMHLCRKINLYTV
jgi:hypothetical protein